jgi:hypothetical protein
MVGYFDMGGYKITNLAAPVAGTDAANRTFVEGVFTSEVPVFYRRWSKTAVGGETSLSGTDDNGISLSYVAGSEKVFINGALQVRGIDYSGTTGTTLTGIPALIAGDIVEVHSSSSYTVGTVPDGSVTNAKVDGGAAIQYSKLALGNSIVDADVNSAAGIATSKLSFTQAGTGAVARTVESKLRDVVSVKDFGAVGDGVTDDTAAIQAACNAIVASGGGTLHVPKGVYRISSLISVLCNAQQHFRLTGEGRYVSTFDFSTGSNLGFLFRSTSTTPNQLPSFEVSDIGLITSRDNAGTALWFDYASDQNIDASCCVSDVFIGQNIDRISDQGSGYGYWTTGIRTSNCRNGEVRNVHAYGELNKPPGSAYGIRLELESTAFVISDCLFLEFATGISVVGTTEGVYIDNTDCVYCYYGAYADIASGAEPQFTAVGCSFNCSNAGVWLKNFQQSVIADSLFYAAGALHTGSWPNWTGVLIQGANSRFNKVVGCTFTKENGRTGDITSGIDFNQGRCYSATGNHFFGFSGNELSYGIQVRSGVSNVRIGDDQVFEHVTSRYDNNGTTAIRQPIVQRLASVYTSGDTVTFPQAFTTTPVVTAIHQGTNTAVNVTVSAVTSSSFVVNHNGGGSVAISWVAVGD